jgi:hypothetical protein
VPAQFDGQLINRRKHYPPALRGTLSRTYVIRQVADYTEDEVPKTQAERLLRRTRTFVQMIIARGDESA